MNIKIGQKVRVIPTSENPKGKDIRGARTGKIEYITKSLLGIRYNAIEGKGNLESFNIADIVAPKDYYLQMFINKEWVRLELPKRGDKLMSYNDGWRIYEDEPLKVEKINMLQGVKVRLEIQLEKQQKKVIEISEKTRQVADSNVSIKRKSVANMRLSDECNYRDRLLRRIDIVEEWVKEIRGIN